MDSCGDGETALEMLAAERYDLVLPDLNLPRVDGMQVLRTLRQQDLETCVLILSARSEIAVLHGGTAVVEESSPRGTTFAVTLPLEQVPSAQRAISG